MKNRAAVLRKSRWSGRSRGNPEKLWLKPICFPYQVHGTKKHFANHLRAFPNVSQNDCFAALQIDSVTFHRPAAVSSKPPYRFRSRGTRDPTDAATGGVAAYDRFTVLWLSFLSLQFAV